MRAHKCQQRNGRRPADSRSADKPTAIFGGSYLETVLHYTESERRWRATLTVALAVYGWLCLLSPGTGRWIDSLDLAIHETGHLVFCFGGEVLAALGGTLFQLIVPAAFALSLWRRGDWHGATVPLWWMGQNCWNISVYVRDARTQELPLVGGGEHDWAFLLDRAGWLERDQGIGGAVYLAGFVLYAIAILWGWIMLRSRAGVAGEAAVGA